MSAEVGADSSSPQRSGFILQPVFTSSCSANCSVLGKEAFDCSMNSLRFWVPCDGADCQPSLPFLRRKAGGNVPSWQILTASADFNILCLEISYQMMAFCSCPRTPREGLIPGDVIWKERETFFLRDVIVFRDKYYCWYLWSLEKNLWGVHLKKRIGEERSTCVCLVITKTFVVVVVPTALEFEFYASLENLKLFSVAANCSSSCWFSSWFIRGCSSPVPLRLSLHLSLSEIFIPYRNNLEDRRTINFFFLFFKWNIILHLPNISLNVCEIFCEPCSSLNFSREEHGSIFCGRGLGLFLILKLQNGLHEWWIK